MKILNVYYGLQAFDFNTEPHHSAVRYDASEEEIEMYKESCKKALMNKKCFWYLLEVTEILPLEGKVIHFHVFDSVEEKKKIILNEKAGKTKPSIKSANIDNINDLMANTVAGNPPPLHPFWNPIVKEVPMPAPVDAPIFF